jgi:serine/threonine protein kinase
MRVPFKAIRDIHECGIVHHDISPPNVLYVTAPGGDGPARTILLDFGLALHGQPLGSSWHEYDPTGTKGFIAPELTKQLPCDHKIDVWSAGAVLAFQVRNHVPSFPHTHTHTVSDS